MVKKMIIFIVITGFIITIFFETISYASFIPATTELYGGLYDGKVIAYSEINKDLAEQVDYYRAMYHEKDTAVKILQEKCGVE